MGAYQLIERVGEGGMGEVWRAKHRLLARPAAIKVIRGDRLGDDQTAIDEALVRFEREAQATAKLRSPHTVELYDFGRAEDGAFYYVMELLDGVDLDELVQRSGPLEPARVVHVLRQACLSLGEAHEADLLHRDIKPANMFLCRMGNEYDFVKVLDFGLVKPIGEDDLPAANWNTGEAIAIGRSDSTDSYLTVAGSIRGTPAFMSPEQILGDGLDGRSDIYALGCVAYWLLTGQLVFSARDMTALLVAQVQQEPVPPSERAPNPVPEALEQLVLACLNKDKERRPADLDDLAARLDQLAIDMPWSVQQAREAWQRDTVSATSVDLEDDDEQGLIETRTLTVTVTVDEPP